MLSHWPGHALKQRLLLGPIMEDYPRLSAGVSGTSDTPPTTNRMLGLVMPDVGIVDHDNPHGNKNQVPVIGVLLFGIPPKSNVDMCP